MNPFIYRLTVVHHKLDGEIRREHKKRVPDSFRLLRLKKLKLAVRIACTGTCSSLKWPDRQAAPA